ncbi:class II aldolase/adducin family protein [Sphingobium fuliginis]
MDARGLAPATAGNYSARLADGTILITRSGA